MLASPDFVIIPPRMKGLDTSARWVTVGGHRFQLTDDKPVSMSDAASIQRTANDRTKSKVLQFGQGEGSLLDKQVRLATNTDKAGKFSPGKLRIEIGDATTSDIYERPMEQLPKLISQLGAKGYALNSQYFRSPKNVLKAEGKWVTLPSGARIQIHGDTGGGQAQTKPRQESKPQAQAQTVERDESQGSEGQGLTHQQRVKIANSLAEKMGIDKSSIKVEKNDVLGGATFGVLAGTYDPKDGKITLYPSSFSQGKEELIGTLTHEAQHAKFDKVLRQYNEQQKQFQAGTSLTSGAIDTFKELKTVFAQEERITYSNADGFNQYSTLFWDRYKANPTTQTYVHAINETLAETARLTQAGKGGDIHPQITSLYNRVNRLAKGL